MASTLYYILDPMCSWCYGYRPVWTQLLDQLPADITIRYVMGGLAADSDEPMPDETRQYIQSQWRKIEQCCNVSFNWDFWTQCQPRRSTWPACRAVLAAGRQQSNHIAAMIQAIQNAYYQQARNPSDITVLIDLAAELGLDTTQFSEDLLSAETEDRLQQDFALRRSLQVSSFPSLRLETGNAIVTLPVDYQAYQPALQIIHQVTV